MKNIMRLMLLSLLVLGCQKTGSPTVSNHQAAESPAETQSQEATFPLLTKISPPHFKPQKENESINWEDYSITDKITKLGFKESNKRKDYQYSAQSKDQILDIPYLNIYLAIDAISLKSVFIEIDNDKGQVTDFKNIVSLIGENPISLKCTNDKKKIILHFNVTKLGEQLFLHIPTDSQNSKVVGLTILPARKDLWKDETYHDQKDKRLTLGAMEAFGLYSKCTPL